ncbi:MAG: hypothetical protein J7M38_03365, partial [Armatimonadetes bacterium]|nr:hypothetical protein [Armatimonadota bacterium]
MPRLTLMIIGITIAALPAAALDNLLDNPGFETIAGDGAFTSWTKAEGSPGELLVAAGARSGEHAAHLTAAAKDGEHFAVLRSRHVRPVWGARYRGAVWCRGGGEARVGIERQFRIRRRGDVEFETTWSDPVALDEDWRPLEVEASLLSGREIARIRLTVEVRGEGASALCDDAELAVVNRLTVTPPYAMLKRGESFDFDVQVTAEGRPVTEGALALKVTNAGTTVESELPITGATTAWSFAAPAEVEDALFSMVLSSSDLGVAARVYAHAVDAETYARFEQAAAEAQLVTPAHLLFIGDSLSDVHRDHNYTDEVAFWLWKTHGGRVTYRNAGVGGDFITRTWSRLQGDPRAYRLYMYDDRIGVIVGRLELRGGLELRVIVPQEDEDMCGP